MSQSEDGYTPTIADGDAPAEAKQITLRVQTGSRRGESMSFDPPTVTLGRRPDCDVQFDNRVDVMISGLHAKLMFEAGAWFIEDAGSTNGSLVNRQPLTAKRRLYTGDVVCLGKGGGEGSVLLGVEIEGEAGKAADGGAAGQVGGGKDEISLSTDGGGGTSNRPPEARPPGASGLGRPPAGPPPGGMPRVPSSAKGATDRPVWDLIGRVRDVVDSRRAKKELQQHVAQLEGRRPGLQAAEREAAKALGEAAWRERKSDVEGLAAAEGLRQLDEIKAEAQADVERAKAKVAELDREQEAWLSKWQSRHEKLSKAADEAEQAAKDATAARQAAEAKVRELIAPRLEALEQVASRIGPLAAEQRDDPADDIASQLRDVVTAMKETTEAHGESIEGLDDAVAARQAAREAAAEAKEAETQASLELAECLDAKSERKNTHEASRKVAEKTVEDNEQQVAQIESKYGSGYIDLGRAIVESHIEAVPDLAELEGAKQAKQASDANEQQIREAQHAMNALG